MKKKNTSTALFALLITVVLHVGAFLYVNLSTLTTTTTLYKDMAVIELDFRTEEEIEEILQPTEPIIDESNQSIKDLMQDIQDIRNKSLSNFSESKIKQEIEQDVLNTNKKNSSQQDENSLEKSEENSSKTEESDKNLPQNTLQPKKENQYGGKVTKYCNVPGRECTTTAPSYKCQGGGEVYIEIKVDKIGSVRSAKVNSSKSTTTSECIINQALEYAKRTTKVSSDLRGEHSDKGYIIYNFISQ